MAKAEAADNDTASRSLPDSPAVAVLTPAGTAALATIGVIGPGTSGLVESAFTPANPRTATDQPRFGKFGPTKHGLCDDVVVITRDRETEIHCHGGPAVVRGIVDLLVARGAVEIGWTEWLERTARSRIQSQAAIALSRALTIRTASILLDQVDGVLSRTLARILDDLTRNHADAALEQLGDLIRWSAVGLHLTTPWRVVLAGPPNVGKSSLLNALLGYARAITSPIPGTTRDLVSGLTAIDGWPVEFTDTAGIHDTGELLESAGVARAQAALAEADLCVWLMDISTHRSPPPPETPRVPVIIAANKIDLEWQAELSQLEHELVPVSAKTGAGVDALLFRVVHRLVPDAPPPRAAVPFMPEHLEPLRAACDHTASDQLAAAAEWLRMLR